MATLSDRRNPIRRQSAKQALAEKIEGGQRRLVAEISEPLYRAVKHHCFDRGIQIRELIIEMLAERGIKP
jgi:hypothetical protein